MKKARAVILALMCAGLVLAGPTDTLKQDTKTHKVVKPPPSSQASFDIDFSDVTTNLAGGGGGGGTPGGANKQFQFNNASTFGGVPYLTYDPSTQSVTETAGGRYTLTDPTDVTKRVQFAISVPTGTLKTLSIFDTSVGVVPSAAVSNQFVTAVNGSDGTTTRAQPTFSNLGGTLSLAQTSMNTGKVLGRTTAGVGAIEELSAGANITIAGGTISATGGGAPGGSTGQLQWNNGGALAGITSLTSDGTVV